LILDPLVSIGQGKFFTKHEVPWFVVR